MGELSLFPADRPSSDPGAACTSWSPEEPSSSQGTDRGQGHPEVLEMNTGQQERKVHEGEKGLSRHPSSNIHGSSIWPWPLASLLMKEPHSCWITRCPPPTSLPSPSPFPVSGCRRRHRTDPPLLHHARAQGVPRSPISVFSTEGSFGGLLIAMLYFIKGGERERFEGHL